MSPDAFPSVDAPDCLCAALTRHSFAVLAAPRRECGRGIVWSENSGLPVSGAEGRGAGTETWSRGVPAVLTQAPAPSQVGNAEITVGPGCRVQAAAPSPSDVDS